MKYPERVDYVLLVIFRRWVNFIRGNVEDSIIPHMYNLKELNISRHEDVVTIKAWYDDYGKCWYQIQRNENVKSGEYQCYVDGKLINEGVEEWKTK